LKLEKQKLLAEGVNFISWYAAAVEIAPRELNMNRRREIRYENFGVEKIDRNMLYVKIRFDSGFSTGNNVSRNELFMLMMMQGHGLIRGGRQRGCLFSRGVIVLNSKPSSPRKRWRRSKHRSCLSYTHERLEACRQ